ncbi:hypothetical protein PC123_g6915 [Phytophthora cactorum]|nr:hypothetical protein PC123_g6915 [Phytophthora cactorum]
MTAGVLERTLEVILAEMSPRLTSLLVILLAKKLFLPQPRVQVQLVVLETLPRLHDLMFLVAKVPRLILSVQGQTKGRHRYLVLLHLSEEHHRRQLLLNVDCRLQGHLVAAHHLFRKKPGPPGSTSTDESSSCPRPSSGSLIIRELSTVGPTILGHAFTAPGAKSCFERVLSRASPDPTPGDVVIRVTIESLRAFFDYEDPNHPWQIMRQLLPEEPCLFDIAGFDPKAHVSKRSPYETRIKVLWANFRGDGPKPDLGFALWERYHWILTGAVKKGFAREASDPNHDRALLKKSVIVPRHSFIRPELIVEPSVPSYPVDPLPLVPKTTDWLAEAAALERRQPWRAAWVFAPFDHPYNTTYVPCHHGAPIFCSRTADPIAIGRAIMADQSLTPAQLAPDWQRRFFSAPGSPRQSSAAASAGGGNDGSSASEAPPVAHASPPDE